MAGESDDERTPPGIVWLDLVVRHFDAACAKDKAREKSLWKLIQALEAEYPEAVEQERARWQPLEP